MRIGLNFGTGFEDSVSVSLNENRTTAYDLLALMQIEHLNACRFLKIPRKKDGNLAAEKFQTIEIDPSNINSAISALGFQDDANYTVIPLPKK